MAIFPNQRRIFVRERGAIPGPFSTRGNWLQQVAAGVSEHGGLLPFLHLGQRNEENRGEGVVWKPGDLLDRSA
jgi:hypothetical protein